MLRASQSFLKSFKTFRIYFKGKKKKKQFAVNTSKMYRPEAKSQLMVACTDQDTLRTCLLLKYTQKEVSHC